MKTPNRINIYELNKIDVDKLNFKYPNYVIDLIFLENGEETQTPIFDSNPYLD